MNCGIEKGQNVSYKAFILPPYQSHNASNLWYFTICDKPYTMNIDIVIFFLLHPIKHGGVTQIILEIITDQKKKNGKSIIFNLRHFLRMRWNGSQFGDFWEKRINRCFGTGFYWKTITKIIPDRRNAVEEYHFQPEGKWFGYLFCSRSVVRVTFMDWGMLVFWVGNGCMQWYRSDPAGIKLYLKAGFTLRALCYCLIFYVMQHIKRGGGGT